LKKKVGIISLGCPKNLVDSEIMLGLLKKNDFEITSDSEEANVIIVNTCGFIESAKEESINTILEMANYKNKNCEMLIVAGCLAQRYKDEIIKEMPEVDAVVGVSGYDEIAKVIEEFYSKKNDKNDKEKNNERLLSTNSGYAYLKISEGCDNRCTYCAIPYIRGPYRSRKMEDIISEAEFLAGKGVKEVILVAQDVTVYGKDLYGQKKLVELVREVSGIDTYPEEIDEELIKEIANNEKVVKEEEVQVKE